MKSRKKSEKKHKGKFESFEFVQEKGKKSSLFGFDKSKTTNFDNCRIIGEYRRQISDFRNKRKKVNYIGDIFGGDERNKVNVSLPGEEEERKNFGSRKKKRGGFFGLSKNVF